MGRKGYEAFGAALGREVIKLASGVSPQDVTAPALALNASCAVV